MKRQGRSIASLWTQVALRCLPFADGASEGLPIGRLLRLSLFQVSVGLALVLLNGTLNRVMIVELGVSASVVTLMVALPVLLAPLRLFLGYRSDYHRSFLGWRRVPYIWIGTMLQFGGLAIMPFALIVLSGDAEGPAFVGPLAAGLAFLLVGLGIHTTQTAGLALASDLAEPDRRHRVVALLYVMLLVGTCIASLVYAYLLSGFSQLRLIQTVQGVALATMVLNIIALWKQESRQPHLTRPDQAHPDFSETWRQLRADPRSPRLMLVVGLGAAGFGMQDIMLEPAAGQLLDLSVAGTTLMNAVVAGGTLVGFAAAARSLDRRGDPMRVAAGGLLTGIAAFCAIVFSVPLHSADLFRIGAGLIGFGFGLFSVGTLTSVMILVRDGLGGQLLGAWGAVQATASGLAIAISGPLRDVVSSLSEGGALGTAMTNPASGYLVVFHLEIALLFLGLAVIGPLVGRCHSLESPTPRTFGLAEHPG